MTAKEKAKSIFDVVIDLVKSVFKFKSGVYAANPAEVAIDSADLALDLKKAKEAMISGEQPAEKSKPE